MDGHNTEDLHKIEKQEWIDGENSVPVPLNTKSSPADNLQYTLNEIPPWHITLLMGIQHYLLCFTGIALLPMVFAKAMCLPLDGEAISNVSGTMFFVAGISSLLQTTLGVRLPIVQGPSASFFIPLLAILAQPRWICPSSEASQSNQNISMQDSYSLWLNLTAKVNNVTQLTQADEEEPWKSRMREIQGTLMMASLFQIIVGISGVMTYIVRFIGPITIATTISLIGLSLAPIAVNYCSKQWGIALLTITAITVFSQYLQGVKIPLGTCNCSLTPDRSTNVKRKEAIKMPIITMFAIILALLAVWLFCCILTISGAIGDNENDIGYMARTDLKYEGLAKTHWFRVPYPFQWGRPTLTLAGVLGMLAAPMASIIESIGDYYVCAKQTGAPPPPSYAINRGIMLEGVGCLLAGMWGTGPGLTSYTGHIAALRITQVGSRRVIQITSVIMIICSPFCKMSAVLLMIPSPVMGGVFFVTFGLVTAMGLSCLHQADLTASRNIYILAVSLFIGICVPQWIKQQPDAIKTGVDTIDQIFLVLLQSGMLLGGTTAFILDNTIPGTKKQRGISMVMKSGYENPHEAKEVSESYDIPFTFKLLRRFPCLGYLPICPNYMKTIDE